jgi:ribosomal protein L37E
MQQTERLNEIKQMTVEFPLPTGPIPDRHEECRRHGTSFHAVYEECPACRAEEIRKRDAAAQSMRARLYGQSETSLNLPVFRPTAGEVFGDDSNAEYREEEKRESEAVPTLGWWILLGGVFWIVLIACGAAYWAWKIKYR